MGFLKRFFSLRSKKNKQKPTFFTPPVGEGLTRTQVEEQEAALGRLLRSSSTRFAVVSEVDYSSLPPLPHPINSVVTPEASTASLGCTSVIRPGTYTVTVHGRTRCNLSNAGLPAPSELGTASSEYMTPRQQPRESIPVRYRSRNICTPMTPRDSNDLRVLRQDPSVVSLLSMYDEHGCLPAKAFSNTPPSPPRGRAQTRRNGSTLRQLLGNPVSGTRRREGEDGSDLGDISWAEHLLREHDKNSPASSFDTCLETPTDLDSPFTNNHVHCKHANTPIPKDHDLSNVTNNPSVDNPAISSMEVEISMVADSPPLSASHNPSSPYQHENPITPQRASQVFDFLTKRHKPHPSNEVITLCLPHPQLPPTSFLESPFKSPVSDVFSDLECGDISLSIPGPPDAHIHKHRRTFSLDSSGMQSSSPQLCADSHRSRGDTPYRSTPILSDCELTLDGHSSQNNLAPLTRILDSSANLTENLRTSKPSSSPNLHMANSFRCVREPKQSMVDSVANSPYGDGANVNISYDNQLVLGERSNQTSATGDIVLVEDKFTAIPCRTGKRRGRMLGRSSSVPFPEAHNLLNMEIPFFGRAGENGSKPRNTGYPYVQEGKENGLDTKRDTGILPVTPVGRHSRTLFSFRPLPSLSSELSPIGQQLMTDLRQQRARARERERKEKRTRSQA